MHVCFLNMPIEYYSPVSGGAISTIIMQTAQELLGRGHSVSVLTRVGDEVYSVGNIIPLGVKDRDDLNIVQRRLSRLRGRVNRWDWPFYEYYQSAFTRALTTLSPDAVILFNDLVSPKYIRPLLPNARIVVWLQNEQGTNQKDLRDTLACTDCFLTCSSYIRDWMIRRYGVPESKFVVAHSGVDLQAFYPREDYLAPTDAIKTLFIGRIDPNKGPDLAAQAVAAVQQEGLPVSLSVAGGTWFYRRDNDPDEPYFREVKSKVARVGGKVLGHVPRSKVPELVRIHDVAFVLSRANEPFGLVVLEAMASGCAVIASNRGGLPEACGGAALLVDPDDSASVVAALRTLSNSEKTLRAYKQRSVERASQASWSHTADVVEQVLQAAIA